MELHRLAKYPSSKSCVNFLASPKRSFMAAVIDPGHR
jgi:hypothetical protein